jgi:hypothetical protein
MSRCAGERNAWEKADKAADKAYSTYSAISRSVDARFNSPALHKALEAFVKENGFALADVSILARKVAAPLIGADAELAAADKSWREANKAKEVANNKYQAMRRNVSYYEPAPLVKMSNELRDLGETVDKLEAELKNIPRRNESARDRRQGMRDEAQRDQDTETALNALDKFVWPAPSTETK